ncbi:hypothetical protein K458DRAFT_392020 [Lentithecium fluviatile CBS 122367]|uniref:Uncharacterized protein n=1 Tax=Lentithecium fluviatile CBS 122367 TaxID=1168545 RepID=A0A6G1ISJ7_9PLEO|nr:hypothetical protein K458DRAFT_392020 [Lentithecium fluviatile CBS 122367]
MAQQQKDAESMPTQSEFLETQLVCCKDTPQDTECLICRYDYNNGEETVKIAHNTSPTRKATCFFHKDCILAWFKSGHQKRGTCPNDRATKGYDLGNTALDNSSAILARVRNLFFDECEQRSDTLRSIVFGLDYDDYQGLLHEEDQILMLVSEEEAKYK